MTYVCSDNVGRDPKQIYDELCESIVDNFDQIVNSYGDKKVTICLNIHSEGKRKKPHVNDQVNPKTYEQFFKDEYQ